LINYNSDKLVSIVICTRNRASFLDRCLKSIQNQNNKTIPIIIIDNGSNDNTNSIINKWRMFIPNLETFHESNIGLSYARNYAIDKCNSEFIHYIDDDTTLENDFCDNLISFLITFKPKAYTGKIIPVFITKRPEWYKNEYLCGENAYLKTGKLDDGHIMGGNMGFNTKLLLQLEGFPNNYGKGSKIMYCEETFVEYKIRSRKIQVYYCEEIKINHFGNDDTIWKILKIFYHQNLSFMQLESNRIANKKSLKIIFYDFKQCAKHLLKGIILIVKQREYYFQNFLIDVLKPLIRSYAFITLLRKNNFSL
jgi:glycosyltransferase involved in cell wall biosynthesis